VLGQTPSFDCATNRAPDEITICGNSHLAQLDRQLGDLYVALRAGLDPDKQLALRDVQRSWLRQRATCGRDASCIAHLYQLRISQLSAPLRPAPPPAPEVARPTPETPRPTPETPRPAPEVTRPPRDAGQGPRDACDVFKTLC
jgi:uncharacterized protein